MTAESGHSVRPIIIQTNCQHCDHEIDTTVCISPAATFGGSVRVRCAECGRATPYQEGGWSEPSPEWFVPLADAESVVRFNGEVEA
jgi:ribosomal protein S27E